MTEMIYLVHRHQQQHVHLVVCVHGAFKTAAGAEQLKADLIANDEMFYELDGWPQYTRKHLHNLYHIVEIELGD